MSEKHISEEAYEYVKRHRRDIIAKVVGEKESQTKPISVFMAGSPGAGKTEFSVRLLQNITNLDNVIVRIDPDDIRMSLPMYEAGRAEAVQRAVSKAVDITHDYCLKYQHSFLLDGTFSNLDVARTNIDRSLAKGRVVRIEYVFQPPQVAWNFTQERELVDGRNIQREDFIRQFVAARDNVSILKREYGKQIHVDVCLRDIATNTYTFHMNANSLEKYLEREYSEEELHKII